MRAVEFHDYLTLKALPVAFVPFTAKDADTADAALSWLSESEANYARRLTATPRRAAWIAGRVAAKRAIARFTGARTPLQRIEVLPSAPGMPVVSGARRRGEPTEVSISHSQDLAAAVAFSRLESGAVGIDLETCDQDVDPALLELAFTASEARALMRTEDALERHVAVLLFWTAKEAALKAAGRGLRLPLAAVELSLMDDSAPVAAIVHCSPVLSTRFALESVRYHRHVVSIAVEDRHAR